jgi:hypothetical protein
LNNNLIQNDWNILGRRAHNVFEGPEHLFW